MRKKFKRWCDTRNIFIIIIIIKNLFKKEKTREVFSTHTPGSLCLRARTRELIAHKHTRHAHTCIREESLTERAREREREKKKRERNATEEIDPVTCLF